KGIEMPKQAVDLRKGENREAVHLKRTPHGQMPTLELDNGNYAAEIKIGRPEGHRDAEAGRRSAPGREPRGPASEAQSAWTDADARTRQRQLRLGDHRDLRIPRREASQSAADRDDAGRARRMPDVDAPRRSQHLRAYGQRLPLRRRSEILREADPLRAGVLARPEDDRRQPSAMAQQPD